MALPSRLASLAIFACALLALLFLVVSVEAQHGAHNDKFYQILEVPKDASPRQIKKAYRKLSIEWHPDRAQDEELKKVHHEKMIDLNKAFEVLGDADKRKKYDMYGEEGSRQMQAHQHHQNFDNLFNMFFGQQAQGHGGHRQQQQQQQQQRQQQCVQTVNCRNNVCTQTTVCH